MMTFFLQRWDFKEIFSVILGILASFNAMEMLRSSSMLLFKF